MKFLNCQKSVRICTAFAIVFLSTYLMAEDDKKYQVALPGVWSQGNSNWEAYENSFYAGFTRSGLVSLDTSKTNETIKAQATQTRKKQEIAQGLGKECVECFDDITGAMNQRYHYVIAMTVKPITNAYQVSVQFKAARAGLPAISGYTAQAPRNEQELLRLIEKMAEYISYNEFTLRGSVTYVDKQKKTVSLDIGRDYKVANGAIFKVNRKIPISRSGDGRVASYRTEKLGTVEVNDVNSTDSNAKLDDGNIRDFKAGAGEELVAELVQSDKLKQVKKEYDRLQSDLQDKINAAEKSDKNLADKKREAEEEKYEKNRDDSVYARRVDNVTRKGTLRLGASGLFLNQLADRKTNSYFDGNALAGYIDYMAAGRGDYFSSGVGGFYRTFSMKNRHDLAGQGSLDIFGFSVMMRFYLLHFQFLWSIWSPYLMLDARFVYAKSSADIGNTGASFMTVGIAGRGGLQWSLGEVLGFYAEAIYGYTPIGVNKTNIDGLQVVAGMLFRFKD